jgi:hypothetical protein
MNVFEGLSFFVLSVVRFGRIRFFLHDEVVLLMEALNKMDMTIVRGTGIDRFTEDRHSVQYLTSAMVAKNADLAAIVGK